MDGETRELVGKVLDQAVAAVAKQKIEEITGPLEEGRKNLRIAEATDSLDELRRGGIPEYSDPLVDAFYMVQYQLQHINLTYSMIMSSTQIKEANSDLVDEHSLHVVDYGCGALAMRFGVVLAIADALERGQQVRNLRIDSLDPAIPLVELGVEIWSQFLELVAAEKSNKLRWLMQAIAAMERPHPNLQLGVQLKEISGMPNANHWLSAVHVVYGGPEGNSDEVRENLAYLRDATNSDMGFITTHSSKEKTAMAVSPFGEGYSLSRLVPVPLFNNGIPAPLCAELLHEFRPANWRTFWEWDPGTSFLTYRKL